jgi:hypothetical protein
MATVAVVVPVALMATVAAVMFVPVVVLAMVAIVVITMPALVILLAAIIMLRCRAGCRRSRGTQQAASKQNQVPFHDASPRKNLAKWGTRTVLPIRMVPVAEA